MIDFTTVVGVDRGHLEQLQMTWPTWQRHRPEIFANPILVFYDPREVTERQVRVVVGSRASLQQWGIQREYPGTRGDKWTDPQRFKMLSGFVHVPAKYCETAYWLKLDTDCVAKPHQRWYEDDWFANNPAIVAHRWGHTKPPNQMTNLDKWAITQPTFVDTKPLLLIPNPGASKLHHGRIISWCGFFNTEFTKRCAEIAPEYAMPVPSQDGYMWYVAKRLGYDIKRVNMKSRGWEHWLTRANISRACQEALSV